MSHTPLSATRENAQMHWRFAAWVMLCFVCSFFIAQNVQAAIADTGAVNTGFRCAGATPQGSVLTGIANAPPGFGSDPCGAAGGIFGRVLCVFESTLSQVVGNMYCAMAENSKGPLSLVLILYMTVFAIMFITGMVKFSAGEVAKMYFKIILVWVFATQAEFAIGIAYNFFISFATGGANLVMSAVGAGKNAGAMLSSPDAMLGDIFGSASNAVTKTTSAPASNVTTGLIGAWNAIPASCKIVMGMVALALFLFIPGLFLILILFLGNYIKMFAEAMVEYLIALVLISFLIILSPIFLAFALFNSTTELFSSWLKYLGLNALKMLIVMGFFALALMLDLSLFFEQLFRMIVPYTASDIVLGQGGAATVTNWAAGALNWNITFCSLCEHTFTGGNPFTGDPQCKAPGLISRKIPAIPWTMLPFQAEFIFWVASKTFALWALGYILNDFLEKAGELTNSLGGVRYAGVMRSSNPDYAALGKVMAFPGIQAGDAAMKGFRRGFMQRGIIRGLLIGNAASNFTAGAKEGWHSLIHGYAENPALYKAISNAEREIEGTKKTITKAHSRALITADMLDKTLRRRQQGTATDADVASVRIAHSIAAKNEKYQKNKLEKSQQRLAQLRDKLKYSRTPGLKQEVINALGMGDMFDEPLDPFNPRRDADDDKSFYMLDTSKYNLNREEYEQSLLDNLKHYAAGKAETVKQRLDLYGSQLNDFERGNIERSIASVESSVMTGDMQTIAGNVESLQQAQIPLDTYAPNAD